MPNPESFALRVGFALFSVLFVAVGIFLYMPANVMPLAGEGAMMAVSKVSGIKFHKVKIGFDVSMVSISLVVCAVLLHSFGSVGLGTVLAAVLVGIVLGFINRCFGPWRDSLLSREGEDSDGNVSVPARV